MRPGALVSMVTLITKGKPFAEAFHPDHNEKKLITAQKLRISLHPLFWYLFSSISSPPFLTTHPSHLAASPADETPLIRPDLLISPLMSGVTRDRQAD